MSDFKFKEFWDWFEINSNKLESSTYDKDLLAYLDKTISGWGLVWEIGPGKMQRNSLTISANGTNSLISKAENIINLAPPVGNWEYYSSKQKKENWHLLVLPETDNKIDASGWTYVLLQYGDGKKEILVKPDNLSHFDNEMKSLIVDLVLINLLGEIERFKQLDFIDIVENHESDKGITALKHLPKHLSDKRYFP